MLAVFVMLLLLGEVCSPIAHAAFLPRIDVSVTKQNDNKYLYKYTLINISNSDLPIVSFALDLDDYVVITNILGPPTWGHLYFPPKPAAIVWGQFNSLDFTPIIQGKSNTFIFESKSPPGLVTYEVDGLDATGQIPDHKFGEIAGPSVDSPEPDAK